MGDLFDSEIIPVVESLLKQKPTDYTLSVRLLKLTVLLINNLGVGLHLLVHILQETDGIFTRTREGQPTITCTWRSQLAFEGLAATLANPNIVQVFAQSAIQVGKTVLVQVFESLMQASAVDFQEAPETSR